MSLGGHNTRTASSPEASTREPRWLHPVLRAARRRDLLADRVSGRASFEIDGEGLTPRCNAGDGSMVVRNFLPNRGAYSADSCSCRSTYDGGMDDHRGPTFLDYLTDLFALGSVALFLLVVMTRSACFSVKRRASQEPQPKLRLLAPRVRPSRLSSFPTRREPGHPT